MITATFGNMESYDDLSVFIKSYQVGEAQIKSTYVEIPYADGKLDLTDYFGRVLYDQRSITIGMRTLNDELLEVYHDVQSKLHGKKLKVTFSDDEDWYWYGRLAVGAGKRNRSQAYDFDVTLTADPYQYQDISLSKTFTTAGYIDCNNSEMPTYPVLTTDGGITVEFGTESKTLQTGTHILSSFVFAEGNNRLIITPSDESVKVTVAYIKGRL